jgi:hypothetical protein
MMRSSGPEDTANHTHGWMVGLLWPFPPDPALEYPPGPDVAFGTLFDLVHKAWHTSGQTSPKKQAAAAQQGGAVLLLSQVNE